MLRGNLAYVTGDARFYHRWPDSPPEGHPAIGIAFVNEMTAAILPTSGNLVYNNIVVGASRAFQYGNYQTWRRRHARLFHRPQHVRECRRDGDPDEVWKIEGVSTHQGLPGELVVNVLDSEVTIASNGGRPEVYEFAGTETQLRDRSNGNAEFAGGTLTLTRRTLRGNIGPFVTTIRQVYRLSRNTLTLEWQAFAQGPDDPAGKWSEVERGAYRKIRK